MRSTESDNSAKIEHWTVKHVASGTQVEIQEKQEQTIILPRPIFGIFKFKFGSRAWGNKTEEITSMLRDE